MSRTISKHDQMFEKICINNKSILEKILARLMTKCHQHNLLIFLHNNLKNLTKNIKFPNNLKQCILLHDYLFNNIENIFNIIHLNKDICNQNLLNVLFYTKDYLENMAIVYEKCVKVKKQVIYDNIKNYIHDNIFNILYDYLFEEYSINCYGFTCYNCDYTMKNYKSHYSQVRFKYSNCSFITF